MTVSIGEVRQQVACTNILGEGTVWDADSGSIYWVDIKGCLLQRHEPATGETESWMFDERIGSFALRRDGGILCAMRSGLALFDPDSGELDYFARPDNHMPNNRFNDGRCDRSGRFFVGTMDDLEEAKTGTLYRVDPDFSVHALAQPIGIPNSTAFSPDGRYLYFADTMDGEIRRYDLDPKTGAISNRISFASTRGTGGGHPDGSTVDADGYLWNCEWDGWRITRYAPDGVRDLVVELPVQRPTCCSFGGPDLSTLFITCARVNLSEEELEAQPFAGSLLAVDVSGVRGLPEPKFAG